MHAAPIFFKAETSLNNVFNLKSHLHVNAHPVRTMEDNFCEIVWDIPLMAVMGSMWKLRGLRPTLCENRLAWLF